MLYPWLIASGAILVGSLMLLWGRRRLRPTAPLQEAVQTRTVDQLEPGRFRVVGRVVGAETTTSSVVDGAPCVYVERAQYRAVGSSFVPVLREVDHRAFAHPFHLEDASGRVRVDPARTLIQCATESLDAGLVVERRLRVGEQVTLIATFERAEAGLHDESGPFRTNAQKWAMAAEEKDAPARLTHMVDDLAAMVPGVPDDFTAFIAGVGAMMVGMGTILAFVLAFMV